MNKKLILIMSGIIMLGLFYMEYRDTQQNKPLPDAVINQSVDGVSDKAEIEQVITDFMGLIDQLSAPQGIITKIVEQDKIIEPFLDDQMAVRRYYNPGTTCNLYTKEDFNFYVNKPLNQQLSTYPLINKVIANGYCSDDLTEDGVYYSQLDNLPIYQKTVDNTLITEMAMTAYPDAKNMSVSIVIDKQVIAQYIFVHTPNGWKLAFIDDCDCSA